MDQASLIEQLRIELAFAPETTQATLTRVLLYPKPK